MFDRLRTLFETALILAAGGLALLALAALGGSVSDTLDVLTHFAPLALVAALSLLACSRLLVRRGVRRRTAGLLSVAAAVWSFVLMAPELLAEARPEPAPTGARLTLVSFNVWARGPDPAANAAWLLQSGADVLLLQETEGAKAEALIAALRRVYPYASVCTEQRCSVAVLSRWPMRRTGVQRQRWFGPGGSPLSAAWGEIQAPGGAFVALTTHYTHPTYTTAQPWQRAELVRLAGTHSRDDLVISGDFNLTPWSKALHEQDARLGLTRRTRALFSWPTAAGGVRSPVPVLPIDHVYAGPAWRTVSVRRGPRLASDHYPVIVTLARASGRPGGG